MPQTTVTSSSPVMPMTFDEWDSFIMDDYGFEYVDLEMKGRNQYDGRSLFISIPIVIIVIIIIIN